jgi:hypothetical protein
MSNSLIPVLVTNSSADKFKLGKLLPIMETIKRFLRTTLVPRITDDDCEVSIKAIIITITMTTMLRFLMIRVNTFLFRLRGTIFGRRISFRSWQRPQSQKKFVRRMQLIHGRRRVAQSKKI